MFMYANEIIVLNSIFVLLDEAFHYTESWYLLGFFLDVGLLYEIMYIYALNK